jgi:apolipoprotein N-acyltransferase
MLARFAAPERWRHLGLALVGGVLVALSMPPWGWWPLAFAGVVLFEIALAGEHSRRRRALAGLAFGAGWMFPAMAWMWFLTVPGYLVAALLFASLHAGAAALAPIGAAGTVARPAAHTLAEIVRMVFPFGGVPLATLGIAQSGGPLLIVARVGGVIALTWLVFQVGAAIAALITTRHTDRGRRARPAIASLGVVVVVVVVAAMAPSGSETGTTLGVAVVQGGGEQGTRALDVPSRIVTERHLEATRTIEPSDELDVVVWPENSINVDLEAFGESEEYEAVAGEAARLGVPFVVGVTVDSEFSAYPVDDSFVNAQVVVAPDGEIVSSYEKVHIVPFGEYVPLRGPLEAVGAPLENVPSDATPGQDPAVVSLPDGTALGVMISWEVFFADRARAGADGVMLLNPTNGASYTWTILQTQQVASSLLRATETGRWVIQASPTGFSAFVSPDGDVFERTDVGEQAVITYDVPERVGSTWYSTIGDWPWRLLVVLVLALASWRAVTSCRSITDDRPRPPVPASREYTRTR